MSDLVKAAQQALEVLMSIKAGHDDRDSLQCDEDIALIGAIEHLRQAIEADTKPCACCGEGKAHLSVTRVCDTCGSEYAGQAEMDAAKRIESDHVEHSLNMVLQVEQNLAGYLYEGIAYHTRGKTIFSKTLAANLETRWWQLVGPVYTHPQPAQQPLTEEGINVAWKWANAEFHPELKRRVTRAIESAHGIGQRGGAA